METKTTQNNISAPKRQKLSGVVVPAHGVFGARA
jgi:hypothetical protein